MAITTFALSSMYWIMSIIDTFIGIDLWLSQFYHDPLNLNPKLLDWLPMTSALLLVNVSVHYMTRSHIVIREYP
jgi:hypothetical protein